MVNASAVSIILLAGGEARRLPGKLMLRLDGEPLLLRTFRRLTADGRRPCVVSIRDPLAPELQAQLPTAMIADRFENCGPLGGLASAAAAVTTPLFFAAAGDLPQLSARFVDRLEARYQELSVATGAPAAIIPRRQDGRLEPLAALYETEAFVAGASAAIARGEKKVTAALRGLPVVYYELTSADESELLNINTTEDWQRLHA